MRYRNNPLYKNIHSIEADHFRHAVELMQENPGTTFSEYINEWMQERLGKSVAEGSADPLNVEFRNPDLSLSELMIELRNEAEVIERLDEDRFKASKLLQKASRLSFAAAE